MNVNNVNMEKAGAFAEEVRKDQSKALKVKRVEGEWNFEEGKPQFKAELKHATGTTLVEADGPPFTGGGGMKPDPVQYCLFGLAACFAQTYASIAAEKGVKLGKLKIVVESKVNLLKPLGLGDEPTVEEVKLQAEVSGSAEKDELDEIAKLAGERCPGVYCLTKPIKLSVEVNYTQQKV